MPIPEMTMFLLSSWLINSIIQITFSLIFSETLNMQQAKHVSHSDSAKIVYETVQSQFHSSAHVD